MEATAVARRGAGEVQQRVSSLNRDMTGRELGEHSRRDNLTRKSAEELMKLADEDGNGVLGFEEFKKLHEIWRHTIENDIKIEHAQEMKVKRQQRRLRAALCTALTLVLFLAISCTANAIAVFWIVDEATTTRASSSASDTRQNPATSALTTREGDDISTVESGRLFPLGMLAFLPRYAPADAMGAMPDYVTMQDPADWGVMKAYKVESISFQPPHTLTIRALGGERIILDGPARGQLVQLVTNETDGTTYELRERFCSACAEVQLRSVPSSSLGLQTAVTQYYHSIADLTDDEILLCTADMQVGRLLGLQSNVLGRTLDTRSMDHIPPVCSVPADSALLTGPSTPSMTDTNGTAARRLAMHLEGASSEGGGLRMLKHKESKDKKSKKSKTKQAKEDKHKKNKDKKKGYRCRGQFNAWQNGRNGPNADMLAENYKNCKDMTDNPRKINFFMLDQNDDNCVDISELLAVGIFEAWAADTCDIDAAFDETAELITLWSCCTFHIFADISASEDEECHPDANGVETTPGPFCQPESCLNEEEFTMMLGDSEDYIALWKIWKKSTNGRQRWGVIKRDGGLAVPDLAAAEAICNSVGDSTTGRQLTMVGADNIETPIPDLPASPTHTESKERMRMLQYSAVCPTSATVNIGSLGFDNHCNLGNPYAVIHDPDCQRQQNNVVAGGCHPADTSLHTADGATVRIDQVRPGMLVRTAAGVEPITALMHAEHDEPLEYFRFHTAVGASLAISEGHALFVNGIERNPATVAVGETLTTLCCGEQPITVVERSVEKGRFHITTPSNSYYAGGVLASTYVAFVPLNVWKVAGGLYPRLRYLLGVPITPEGEGPLTIFWPLHMYTLLGLPQPLVDALWPLTMMATLGAELINTAVVQLPVSAAVLALGAAATLRASRK